LKLPPQILYEFNSENLILFAEVITKIKVAYFFRDTVYIRHIAAQLMKHL